MKNRFHSATTKGMKHNVRGCLKGDSFDAAILYFGTNNLNSNVSAGNIATDVMNLAVFVKKEKKTVTVSGPTVPNDKFNDKGKNVNSLLKRKCEEEKMVDNSNITVSS